MKSKLILVADSSRARLFTTDILTSDIEEIETMAQPEARLHERDLTSDLPGKDSGHGYQDQTEPKEQLQTDFARRIARHIEDAHKKNQFKYLLVVSAPAFLGVLRSQFSDQVNKAVCFELNKNLTMHSASDIQKHLPKSLATI